MTIRHATAADLPAIVAIYNASIPARLATADTEPVTVEERRAWFDGFSVHERPLWVFEAEGSVAGWLGLRSFYGRPAYHATVESAVYVAPAFQRRSIARHLLQHAIAEAPRLSIRTILAFVFAHNAPSVALFEQYRFERWGRLPRVAQLDGIERDLLILGLRVAER